MGSKAIVVLGLFVAMVLLVSSEVAARELAETSNTIDTYKHCCLSNEAEKTNEGAVDDTILNGKYFYDVNADGHKGGDYKCRYGCCKKCYYKCCKCCSYAGEKPEADVEAEPHN